MFGLFKLVRRLTKENKRRGDNIQLKGCFWLALPKIQTYLVLSAGRPKSLKLFKDFLSIALLFAQIYSIALLIEISVH